MSFLTPEHTALLRRTILAKCSPDEQDLFLVTVERTQLDPFARQIWPQMRWDGKQQREVMSILITIDGMRSVAERTGEYEGQLGPFWCDTDGVWVDVWTKEHHPHAAKVGILRKGFREPLWAVARFNAYCAMVNEKNGQGKVTGKRLNDVWARMGDTMCAKCAESLGLRRGFPNQLGGLYTEEEFEQALNEAKEEAAGTKAAATTLAPARKADAAPQAEGPTTTPDTAPPLPAPVREALPPEVDAAMHPEEVAAAAAAAEQQPAPAPAPAPAAPPAATGFKVDLPPGPYGVLTSKLASAGLTEAELLAGIGKDVSIATVNTVFAWIKQHAKQ